MVIFNKRFISLSVLLVLSTSWLGHTTARAAVSSDTLMPPSTRGFVSIIDIDVLHKNWQRTQLGQLVRDEAMRPFVEDLKRQLRTKISGVRDKLGIDLADLKDVAGGEIAFGMIERENDRAAIALCMDVTDRHRQLEQLLQKADQELTKREATKSTSQRGDTQITTYEIPTRTEEAELRTAIFFVRDDMFCACDNRAEAMEMLARFRNQSAGLSSIDAYQHTMRNCLQEAQGLRPDLRWYVDPFGYARATRSLAPAGQKRYGKDYLQILAGQGFDAIQGLGGFVNLSVAGSYELLHRTSVYAPPIPGNSEKYRLAMRMLKFPNRQAPTTLSWLPRKLATYRTLNCDLSNAFENFNTLFDAIAGYEEAFAGVLEGLERDPYGPQVDVRQDFVNHLGERVMLVTDYQVPITPQCERFMVVVELKNEEAVANTVRKFMESDPNASEHDYEGTVVWEIQEAEEDIPELDITSSDLDLLDPIGVEETVLGDTPAGNSDEASAICVTDSHLFIASHSEFLRELLSTEESHHRLHSAPDFHEVESSLSRLLPGKSAIRSFIRTDEAVRPVYELLRQGKMPEAETLLGRFLNRLLTPPDEEEEGVLRKQNIDGSKLPEFEMVRRYFGPAGTVIRSEEDGWMMVGASLSKLSPQARIPSSTRTIKSLR